MDDLAEKRVYADRADATLLLVAAAPGLATVAVSGARVGEFGVARECTPNDLAVAPAPGDRLLVATDEDVLIADGRDIDALEPSGFGPATAVTHVDGRPLAAGPTGRLATHDGSAWDDLGVLPTPASALDGDLAGTAEGVVRLVDGELRPAGLVDVTDVARAAGMPLVATGDGLYELGNGWLDVLEGRFDLVAGAPDGRAHAAGEAGPFARTETGWEPLALPTDDPVAAAAHGPRTYLLTAVGDLLVEDDDGWSRHPLGLGGVVAAVAV